MTNPVRDIATLQHICGIIESLDYSIEYTYVNFEVLLFQNEGRFIRDHLSFCLSSSALHLFL